MFCLLSYFGLTRHDSSLHHYLLLPPYLSPPHVSPLTSLVFTSGWLPTVLCCRIPDLETDRSSQISFQIVCCSCSFVCVYVCVVWLRLSWNVRELCSAVAFVEHFVRFCDSCWLPDCTIHHNIARSETQTAERRTYAFWNNEYESRTTKLCHHRHNQWCESE